MSVLAEALLHYLAAAAVLGLAVGWLGYGREPGRAVTGAVLGIGLAALLAAIVLSALAAVPGRAGFALDVAVLLAVPYALGCIAGAVARRLALGRPA